MREPRVIKGRGAVSSPEGRYLQNRHEVVDDGWPQEEDSELPPTQVSAEIPRRLISRNGSPDVPFEQSINPYRGCEHGCIYCYARPTHAYLDLSPGLDFETRIIYKADAARVLRAELGRRGYRVSPITLGANTDPYQPLERRLEVTRKILEVLWETRHPVSIITKGALIERDLDLLAPMAAQGLASVMVSVTSLDDGIKRTLEPRAAAPAARLRVISRLRDAGVPVGVLVAPVIPAITDAEMEQILEAAAAAGATRAAYIVLRLPHEVKDMFRAWLAEHYPLKAAHVMSLVRQMRGGRDNDPRFGARMRGGGEFAALLSRRFRLACRRLGLNQGEREPLLCSNFRPPRDDSDQLSLL